MIRVVLQEVALFLVPFILYALLLLLKREKVLDLETWSRAAATLALAGFALVVASMLYLGLFAERHTGPYVPPHLENGKPVQGGFR